MWIIYSWKNSIKKVSGHFLMKVVEIFIFSSAKDFRKSLLSRLRETIKTSSLIFFSVGGEERRER